MKYISQKYKIVLLALICFPLTAQTGRNFEYVKSEIQRSYDSLRIDKIKPFIISGLSDQRASLSVNASMGVLASSSYQPSLEAIIFRMLIGDYNRTNIDHSMLTAEKKRTADYIMNPPAFRTRWIYFPIQECEEAVRVQTWKILDDLFKRAVGEYVKKQNSMTQTNFDKAELSVPEWANVPALKKEFNTKNHSMTIDRTIYERYAKELSAVFNDYPDLETGSVSISVDKSLESFFSTEGIETSHVSDKLNIYLSAAVKLDNGAFAYDSFREVYKGTKLPPIERMEQEVRNLAGRLSKAPKMEVFNDIYDGPVMFVGDAVVNVMLQNIVSNSRRGVAAERQPLGSMSTGPDYFIGKQLYSKSLTLKDLSGTPLYKGKTLTGYFPVDEDGVEPPKELVLIEKGVIRNMLVGRMPLRFATQTNGHSRMNRPVWGNLQLVIEGTKPYAKLKKEFLKQGRKTGQEYVYVVEKLSNGNVQWMTRINTKTGNETLMRNALLEELRPSSFKQIMGASSEEYILGTLVSNSDTRENVAVSYIVPQALILDNLQLLKTKPQTPVKAPLVPKPTR